MDREAGKEHCHELLRITLKEQLDQTIELALLALEPLHEPGLINIIRAGFTSGDDRHIANACEALENLDKQELTAGLSDILQKSINNDFCSDEGFFQSFEDVIAWCANHRNNWLKFCGDRALQPPDALNNHA
jgi:hypothetical protein